MSAGGPRRAPEDGGSSRRSAHPPAQCRVAAAFRLGSFTDLPLPRDLHKIFQSADYIEWRSFREKDDSRYVTLCLPHLLMRLPYGNDTDPVETFRL